MYLYINLTISVSLKVWPTDGQHLFPRACPQCKLSGPYPDLQNRRLFSTSCSSDSYPSYRLRSRSQNELIRKETQVYQHLLCLQHATSPSICVASCNCQHKSVRQAIPLWGDKDKLWLRETQYPDPPSAPCPKLQRCKSRPSGSEHSVLFLPPTQTWLASRSSPHHHHSNFKNDSKYWKNLKCLVVKRKTDWSCVLRDIFLISVEHTSINTFKIISKI